ncbi:hypothetical protein ACFQMM_23180 [Saliphagus sp. GCM10025308]
MHGDVDSVVDDERPVVPRRGLVEPVDDLFRVSRRSRRLSEPDDEGRCSAFVGTVDTKRLGQAIGNLIHRDRSVVTTVVDTDPPTTLVLLAAQFVIGEIQPSDEFRVVAFWLAVEQDQFEPGEGPQYRGAYSVDATALFLGRVPEVLD